jgi:hypothetical protein
VWSWRHPKFLTELRNDPAQKKLIAEAEATGKVTDVKGKEGTPSKGCLNKKTDQKDVGSVEVSFSSKIIFVKQQDIKRFFYYVQKRCR